MAREKAPVPLVHRTKHTAQSDHWIRKLKKNWHTCDPKWWDFVPTGTNHYFRVSDKKKMIKLLTREEIEQIEIQVESGIGTFQITLSMEMPYDFLVWWIKTTTRSSFAALKTNRDKLTMQQRRKRLVACLMDELEDRLASRVARKQMTTKEILDTSRELVREINMDDKGPGSATPKGPKLVRSEGIKKSDNEKTSDRESEAATNGGSVGVRTH